MKAAVWRQKGRFDVEDVPVPAPAADEVVIKIEYCAVCGTDLHRAYTHGEIKPGVVIGHEYCGRVTAVGSAVSMWKEGDRLICATGGPEPGTEARFTPRMLARTGTPGALEQGAFAEYKRLRASNAVLVPDSVDGIAASLIEPCAIAVHAIERARIATGDRLGILGLGPIGLLVLQSAKAAGVKEVYGVEPSPVRRRAALEMGIDAAFDPRDTDAVEALVSATGGGPEVMFDCAAAPGTLDQALTAVRANGRVVLVGISWDQVAVRPLEWIGRNVELRCMYGYTRAHCERALDLVAGGAIRSGIMVRPEWVFPLDCIHQAFERSLQAALVKAVIKL